MHGTMIARALAVSLLIIAAGISACGDDDPIGGGCVYEEIPGIAEIVSIDPAPAGELNCPSGSVAVFFDFIPDDSTAVFKYTGNWPATNARFIVVGGMNPPLEWIDEQGLHAGSILECVRMQISQGACPGVVYHYPGLNTSRIHELCY